MVQIHSSKHKSWPIVRFPSIFLIQCAKLKKMAIVFKISKDKIDVFSVGPSRSSALPLLFLHTFWRPIVKKKKFRKSKAVVRQVPRDILAQFQSASWMIRSNCHFLTRATQNLKYISC